MESVRVWPVKPGQVYKPVFDAEEQLVQSFQNVKKKKVSESFSSPSASGDFHQTWVAIWETGVLTKISVALPTFN